MPGTAVGPPDSSAVLARARREQERFEGRRYALLPLNPWAGSGGGPCDEVVGRFCLSFGDSDWFPRPERAEIAERRDALLAYLDSVQRLLPGDGWVVGQRVRYLGEAGRWDEAGAAAESCVATAWWCAALRGYALHGGGRYPEAGAAFRVALQAMEPERAGRWRDPRKLLQGEARAAVARAAQEGGAAEEPGARAELPRGPAAMELMWALADPLFLVPGNDRETAHYARWTFATLSERARNPHRISWGRDLDELTVRMGWALGWERARDAVGREWVVGYHHPEGRDFLPRGRALEDPAGAPAEDLEAGTDRARSFHAPAEAPVVLPLEGQTAVFPRGGRIAVVATYLLPADTGRRADREGARPWMEPGLQSGVAPRAGLFLLPARGGDPVSALEEGDEGGALVLEAPAGAWVLGVEVWAPALRRAGRHRAGLRRDTVPPDVPVLSDLLLVRPAPGDPPSLEAAARGALVRPRVGPGEGVAVVWEFTASARSPQEVRYELSARRREGVLRRLARAFRLAGDGPQVALSWSESGPEGGAPVLRRVSLDLAGGEPGLWEITLRARLPGRQTLVSGTLLQVGEEARPGSGPH